MGPPATGEPYVVSVDVRGSGADGVPMGPTPRPSHPWDLDDIPFHSGNYPWSRQQQIPDLFTLPRSTFQAVPEVNLNQASCPDSCLDANHVDGRLSHVTQAPKPRRSTNWWHRMGSYQYTSIAGALLHDVRENVKEDEMEVGGCVGL